MIAAHVVTYASEGGARAVSVWYRLGAYEVHPGALYPPRPERGVTRCHVCFYLRQENALAAAVAALDTDAAPIR